MQQTWEIRECVTESSAQARDALRREAVRLLREWFTR